MSLVLRLMLIAPRTISVNFCLYLLRRFLQDTVEDLWFLIAHRILKKLATEESQPEQGLLGTHFGGIAADSVLLADDGKNRLMNPFELRRPSYDDRTPVSTPTSIWGRPSKRRGFLHRKPWSFSSEGETHNAVRRGSYRSACLRKV